MPFYFSFIEQEERKDGDNLMKICSARPHPPNDGPHSRDKQNCPAFAFRIVQIPHDQQIVLEQTTEF